MRPVHSLAIYIAANLRQLTWRRIRISVSLPNGAAPLRAWEWRDDERHYRLTPLRTFAHRVARVLPPVWRERASERFLRRAGAPGPTAEHVVQYLLSAAKSKRKSSASDEAVVTKGADIFYERQYRQYFNPVMGAFAMTATHALLASGGAPQGVLWWHRRKTYAAMAEETAGAPPIIVIDQQTVAVPLLLPSPNDQQESVQIERWLGGHGPMPSRYCTLIAGEEVRCAHPHVRACEQEVDGALLEVVKGVILSKKLALLALHPQDPDAMGLHITLFGVEVLEPERADTDYGLAPDTLSLWRRAALCQGRTLMFCVGGTEEVFTQCSQNLFVKRSVAQRGVKTRAVWPNAWNPVLSLERLLAMQFETFQVTVSASGVPGASPRNGQPGCAVFLGRRGAKSYLLIPYHPGNAVHGHAAKLWTNAYGTVVIFDDHSSLSSVTVSGPCFVVTHERVEREFPLIAHQATALGRRNEQPMPNPEYWYLQEIAEIVQQREPLEANALDPGRPTCSINAGGQARHGKKPAYFAADTLPLYDQVLQHERERAGRPIDPSGRAHGRWNEDVQCALASRRAHLLRVREGRNIVPAEASVPAR